MKNSEARKLLGKLDESPTRYMYLDSRYTTEHVVWWQRDEDYAGLYWQHIGPDCDGPSQPERLDVLFAIELLTSFGLVPTVY
jgi:hypothetical protein